MAEVRVIARCVARKAKEDQLRALLQGMLAPTHAEAGCKFYEIYEADARGRFYFNEAWENQAALDRHVATPRFKHLQEALSELVEGPFDVSILKKINPEAAAA